MLAAMLHYFTRKSFMNGDTYIKKKENPLMGILLGEPSMTSNIKYSTLYMYVLQNDIFLTLFFLYRIIDVFINLKTGLRLNTFIANM